MAAVFSRTPRRGFGAPARQLHGHMVNTALAPIQTRVGGTATTRNLPSGGYGDVIYASGPGTEGHQVVVSPSCHESKVLGNRSEK